MSTIVYQETLQSCYDNKTIEPMALSLKLTNIYSSSSSKQTLLSTSNNSSSSYSNKNMWSAIESLSLTCQPREQEPVYIHPLAKKSSCILSDKSLEMCTETLGNETGSCVIENDHLLSSPRCLNLSFESNKIKGDPNTNRSRSSSSSSSSNNNKSFKFPPPLSTMSGSNSIQVKTYREDGRLVVRVESAPPSGSCLRAERSDGRLKLSFDGEWSYDDSQEDDEVDHKHGKKDENYKEQYDQRKIEENVEDSEEVEEEETCKVNKMEENVMEGVKLEYDGRVKMELLQYKLPSRCKEGGGGRVVDNERLINRESFWVATT